MDLAGKDRKLRETYNPDKPLKCLYMRLNKCFDYATAASEPITERHVICVAYGLIAETGKFQEYCRTWHAKLEQ